MSRGTRITIAAFTLLALGAACSEDADQPISQPSSQFPDETPAVATGATGSTGVLPTTSPAAGTGTLAAGEITLRVSGDVEADKTLTELITAVFAPPPGGLALVWTAGGTDASTVGIGGVSFTGTKPTSPTLSLTLVAQTPVGISTFSSIDGECDVTMDVAAEDEVSGGFTCDGLVSGSGEVVDVSASFEATG